MHIPESHVQHAFDILKSQDHAVARAAYEFSEKQLKVILAKAELNAEAKTATERQALALASEEYGTALENFRLVAEGYYKARDRRDAANAVFEAWRTERSDQRAAGKII